MTAGYLNDGRGQAGASLLEVLVALSLLATAMLGAAAAQLEALRRAEGDVQREQAAWIGASLAEAMHSPSSETAEHAAYAGARAQARAIAHLPGARVEVQGDAEGVGAVIVHWAHRGIASDSWQALTGRRCPMGEEAALVRCLAFPFVSEK
jgi:hypothetical protein